jgi:glycosyltransferase involved in cell wall biosynthesis
MIIGIDASRAFVKDKTGIEEYSYQVIKHLREHLKNQQVILYTRPGGDKQVDFELPENWEIRVLSWRYLWTQIALSLELFINPIDTLFVPAHTLPFVHPKSSIVTIHGLEYEFSPESYSFYSRLFHRFFIKKSCKWASEIISVSKKTKQDLEDMYKVSGVKIKIIPNGFDKREGVKPGLSRSRFGEAEACRRQGPASAPDKEQGPTSVSNKNSYKKNYLFFVGRLEERKNIIGIIKAFEILKEKYNYQGQLLLGGGQGYGYDDIQQIIKNSEYKKEIVELGFIKDNEKWGYLEKADLFMFPSHSEGFGIPILEAQSMGTPVITSDRSPMKETVGDERALADPDSPENIAKIANKILQDKILRSNITEQGIKNIKRFSWEKTSEEIGKILSK